MRILTCGLRTRYYFLVIITIICGLVFLRREYLLYRWKNQQPTSPSVQLVRTKNFPVIPYPLNLTDAVELVNKLRNGTLIGVNPVNPDYMKIRFAPESMHPCGKSETVDILIMIKSSPHNEEDRMQLRNTWANQNYLSKFNITIKYAFVIGKMNGTTDQLDEKIRKEVEQFKDLVIGDFLDTYRNLTLKTMFGMQWAVKLCPTFKFYVTCDDDSYMSIPNLIKYFWDPFNYPETLSEETPFGTVLTPSEHFYSGSLYRQGVAFPFRDRKNKYYVSIQEYEFRIYPPFFAGYFVALSRETVFSFYHLSPYVKHLYLEDVYMGLLANKLRLTPIDAGDVVGNSKFYDMTSVDRSLLKNMIFIHQIVPAEKRTRFWNMLNKNDSETD